MSNEAAPLMEELKESVADLGRTAADKINANRKAAAGSLEKARRQSTKKPINFPAEKMSANWRTRRRAN